MTRLEYSMAIVRMVNGISDKAQKGKTAVSVSHNAAAAGISVMVIPPQRSHNPDHFFLLWPEALHLSAPLTFSACLHE